MFQVPDQTGVAETSTRIKGLQPGVNPRQVGDQKYVVSGVNFLPDVEGPKSAFFGVTQSLNALFGKVQEFQIDDFTVFFTDKNVYRFHEESMQFYPVFEFVSTESGEPWTSAEVGNVNYFGKKGLDGLLSYNPISETWAYHAGGVSSMPNNPIAVSQNSGRLIVVTDSRAYFSALDNGLDLSPDLTTGAGSYGASLIGGKIITVAELPDGAFVYTTNGIFKLETTEAVTPFRAFVFNRKIVPVNAWCVATTKDREHIILTDSGFYQTTSSGIEIWEQLMSSFFINKFFPGAATNKNYTPRLKLCERAKYLVVETSIAPTTFVGYEAYVYSFVVGEWGKFNQSNLGLVEVEFEINQPAGRRLCYFDDKGYLRKVNDSGFHSDILKEYDVSISDPFTEEFSWFDNGTQIVATTRLRFSSVSSPVLTALPGLYAVEEETTAISPEEIVFVTEDMGDVGASEGDEDWLIFGADEDWSVEGEDADWLFTAEVGTNAYFAAAAVFDVLTIFVPDAVTFNSHVVIGAFRSVGLENPDQLTEIINLAISASSSNNTEIVIDYNDAGPDQDFNTGEEITDYMLTGGLTAVDFSVLAIGTTDDAKTVYDQTVPVLYNIESGSERLYSLLVLGIWVFFEISLTLPLATFQLQRVSATGIDGGRT